jgi:tripartite-type tricarboxylate transporter receptor subunit TctC
MSGWSGPGRAYVRDRIGRGKLRLLVQMARSRDPLHADTPTLLELVKAPLDRQIVELVLERVELGRPVIGPPGIPADRVAMLRAAFDKAVVDPEFLKEAALLKLAIDPMGGAAAQRVIDGLYRTPPAVLTRLRKIVQVAPE